MKSRRLSMVVCSILLLSFVQYGSSLVIEKAHREVSIVSQRAVYRIKHVFKNDERSPVESVLLCMPRDLLENSSILGVFTKSEKEDGDPVALVGKGWTSAQDGKNEHFLCGKYILPTPLTKGKTIEITLMSTMINALKPLPAEIHQGSPQLVRFNDSAHVISPYKILSESSEYILNADNTESHSAPSPAKMEGKALILGPYTNIDPFTSESFHIHYVNHFPFLHASATRVIDISHWGKVHFEERFHLRHTGAKLVGEFSRFDLMTNPTGSRSAVNQIPALVPTSAFDIYYRDDIGNISTSTIRKRKDSLAIFLEPRYPLFGGWSTKFTLGLSFPLNGIVYKESAGRYMMALTVLPVLKEIVYDDVEVRVVLPEGARNPAVELGLPFERTDELQYSYLDVLGRPVVVLKLSNLAPESNTSLRVFYDFNPLFLYQKPLVLVAVFSGALAVWAFLATLEKQAEVIANKSKQQ